MMRRVFSSSSKSFIQIAKEDGLAALIGKKLPHKGGFDSSFGDNLTIDKLEDGVAKCTLEVKPHLCNSYQTLHGGAVSCLVDIMGTLALIADDPNRAGVSVDLSVSYLRAVPVGSVITCVGSVIKTGKSLGFTQVEIYHGDKLTAIGRHTKFL
jgi:acyl-coenzyme A thioesterase 13